MSKTTVLAALALLGGQACLADSYIWEEHFTGPDGTDLLSLGRGYTYEGGPNIEVQLSADRGISISNAPEAAYYRIDIPDFSLASLAAGQELVMSIKSEVQVGGGGFFQIGARDAEGEDFWVGMTPGVPRFDIGASAPNVDTNPGIAQPPLPANGESIEMRTLISENRSRFEWRSFPHGSWTVIGTGTYTWGAAGTTVFETLHLRLAGNYNNAAVDDWEVYVYPPPVQTAFVALVQEDFSGSGDLATKGYTFSSSTPGGTEADIQLSGGTGIRSGALPEVGQYTTNIPCFFSLASLVGTQELIFSIEARLQTGGAGGYLQVGGTDADGDVFYVGIAPGVPRFDIGANFQDVDLNPGFTQPPLPANGEWIELRTLISSNQSRFHWRQITPAVGAWTDIGAGTYSWGGPSEPPTVFKDLFIRAADDYGSSAPFDNWEVSIFPEFTPPPPPPTFGAVVEFR